MHDTLYIKSNQRFRRGIRGLDCRVSRVSYTRHQITSSDVHEGNTPVSNTTLDNAFGRLGENDIRTAHRAVMDRIRRAIVSGQLAGGARLVQADLAKSLAVSVTPVREALRDLASEGLVDFDPFRGATVHSTSLDELEELYSLRRILVPVAVRAGVERITVDELDRAEALAAQMERQTTDPTEWIDINRRFHSVLDAASGQPHLTTILGKLAEMSALYVGVSVSANVDRRRRGDRDHGLLVNAFRSRDAECAVAIALSHLDDTVEIARASLAEPPAQSATR